MSLTATAATLKSLEDALNEFEEALASFRELESSDAPEERANDDLAKLLFRTLEGEPFALSEAFSTVDARTYCNANNRLAYAILALLESRRNRFGTLESSMFRFSGDMKVRGVSLDMTHPLYQTLVSDRYAWFAQLSILGTCQGKYSKRLR